MQFPGGMESRMVNRFHGFGNGTSAQDSEQVTVDLLYNADRKSGGLANFLLALRAQIRDARKMCIDPLATDANAVEVKGEMRRLRVMRHHPGHPRRENEILYDLPPNSETGLVGSALASLLHRRKDSGFRLARNPAEESRRFAEILQAFDRWHGSLQNPSEQILREPRRHGQALLREGVAVTRTGAQDGELLRENVAFEKVEITYDLVHDRKCRIDDVEVDGVGK